MLDPQATATSGLAAVAVLFGIFSSSDWRLRRQAPELTGSP